MISFSESLNSPYPVIVGSRNTDIGATFYVDPMSDEHNDIWAIRIQDDEGVVEIGFGVATRYGDRIGAIDMTNRRPIGSPFRLFATIVNLIDTRYPNKKVYKFISDRSDDVKTKVYMRMATKLAQKYNKKVTQTLLKNTIRWYIK